MYVTDIGSHTIHLYTPILHLLPPVFWRSYWSSLLLHGSVCLPRRKHLSPPSLSVLALHLIHHCQDFIREYDIINLLLYYNTSFRLKVLQIYNTFMQTQYNLFPNSYVKISYFPLFHREGVKYTPLCLFQINLYSDMVYYCVGDAGADFKEHCRPLLKILQNQSVIINVYVFYFITFWSRTNIYSSITIFIRIPNKYEG